MSARPAGLSPTRTVHYYGEDTTIVTSPRRVVIGADTHLDTIHVAAITDTGQPLGDAEFRTNPTGYWAAICWARSFGDIVTAGVEGTSSYGAGLTQALQANAIHVVEVNRPDRAARRRQGKSDPLDAYSAARAALASNSPAVPKDPHTNALKALLTARRGAVKARTAAIQQIKDLLVTAPAEIRERYRGYTTTLTLVAALSRCRPATHNDPVTVSVLTACKTLARRVTFLQDQADEITAELDTLTAAFNPALRAAYGVGPDTAAQLIITAGTNPQRLRSEASFAMLTGVAPIPASSGKPAATDSPAAATAPPTTPCTASPWSAWPTTNAPATTSPARPPPAGPKKRSCGCSNALSPARCSNTSPHPARSTTTATSARLVEPQTSLSPPSPTTSAYGPTTSPASNAASNATTPSPLPTANG
ncbi:transposase [Mycobacterium sp. SM3041]|uniref:IS110 family transposase n=1 Tax=Mycobacterium sp. SM3041 TaxID=3114291 RepID=UPI003204F05E